MPQLAELFANDDVPPDSGLSTNHALALILAAALAVVVVLRMAS